jgi:hypothetical protein
MWAASVGEVRPGRNAIRKRKRSVTWLIAAPITHPSSHQLLVGISAASKPSCSAERAI